MPFDSTAHWTAEQRRNAQVIVQTGQRMGVTPFGIQVALATALQESRLRNLDYGDRDSLGLFQQRPSQGWGTPQQVRDPAYAARKFYTGLLGVKGWEKMPLTQAAQAVQRSGFPNAYAQWAGAAQALLTDSTGTALPKATTAPTGVGPGRATQGTQSASGASGVVPLAPDLYGAQEDNQGLVAAVSEDGSKAAAPGAGAATAPGIESGDEQPNLPQSSASLDMDSLFSGGTPVQYGSGAGGGRQASMLAREAMRYIGTPYMWGGTDLTKGVDCSGFIQALYKRFGISLPRMSMDQARTGTRVRLDQLKTGDLVAWDNSDRNNGADHVAFYLGNGQIIEAPKPGSSVRIRRLGPNEAAWGQRVLG